MIKNKFVAGILKVTDKNSRIRIQDPDPDPSVRGMDPRIRIHPKMSWIRNTVWSSRLKTKDNVPKEPMFFLQFLLYDRRIRIREAQKNMDPTDPDPQHLPEENLWTCDSADDVLFLSPLWKIIHSTLLF